MKVYVFPADMYACGFYRMIWPAWQLKREGLDIEVVLPAKRNEMMYAELAKDGSGRVVNVHLPSDADVIVVQRLTQEKMIPSVLKIREKGIAVIVDIDDDLSAIHPSNVAFGLMHPNDPRHPQHNWLNTLAICKNATMVMTSTPSLLPIYAPHGRGRVMWNCVPERYLRIERAAQTGHFGWAGSVHSHPDDLQVMGTSAARLVREGHPIRIIGDGIGIKSALHLDDEPQITGVCDLETSYPEVLSSLTVGVAPLADTRFNVSKSWLKPLEMASVGVPSVVSPRDEYSRLHKEGIGRLARKPQHWYRELKTLLDNDVLREELSQQGRAAAAEHTIEGNAWRWAELFHDAFAFERKNWKPLERSA